MSHELLFTLINIALLLIGYELIRRNPVPNALVAREAIDIVDALNFLRADEGDTVMLCCDNPDFNGQPDRVVDCNGWWTGYVDRRFGGRTLLDAVRSAAAAKAEKQEARAARGAPRAVVA